MAEDKVTITATTTADLVHVAENCRAADRVEFGFAISEGQTIASVLIDMKARSHRSYTARVNGEIVLVYGLIPHVVLSSDLAFPWAMATTLIEEKHITRLFLARGHIEMLNLTKGYRRFMGIVHEQNRKAIRWLSWMGFMVGSERIEHNGGGFHRFEMIKQEKPTCVQ